MKVLDELDQGSPAWLVWRQRGIGASDASAIMGVSNYSSPAVLLQSKLKAPRGGCSPAAERGKRLEPVARACYQELTGIETRPCCIIHDSKPWLRASLDGLSLDNQIILEIKCVNFRYHAETLNGKIPPEYWPQVQHQLATSELPFLHYFSYSEHRKFAEVEKKALVIVFPDTAYIEELLAAEERFLRLVGKARGHTTPRDS